MKFDKRLLVICAVIPLLLGVGMAVLTMDGMKQYQMVQKPSFAPPAWLFPIVWTILYLLMGNSSYRIITAENEADEILDALTVYTIQLAVNIIWPVFFFICKWYQFSFLWLLFLWVLILIMLKRFARLDKWAARLNIPYLIWVTFATGLNFGLLQR